MPSGPTRRMAAADVVVSAFMIDIALPFGALAMFGYGVFPRKNASITGEPPFLVLWDEAKRKKDTARKDRKQ
jgi:hypothetical protein